MKTVTLITSLFFLTFFTYSVKETNTKEIVKSKTNINLETGCYWSGLSNTYTKRGESCSSDTSLKVYYSNPYNYKVRVALYMRDEYGNTKGSPYIIHVSPGRKESAHKCYSNGTYSVLVARYGEKCTFPDYY